MAKRKLKEWLESSPWVVLAGIVAAVLTFMINAGEQGWALYEKFTAKKPPEPSVEVASQRGFYVVRPTAEALKIPSVRNVFEGEKAIAKLLVKPPPVTGVVPLWPVQLLVLNPTKERLSLHSCTMHVYAPEMKLPAFSFGYFVSEKLELTATDEERLITIEPEGAQHIHVVFLMADIHRRQYAAPEYYSKPNRLDISCKDQSRREITARHTFYTPLKAADKRKLK